ncbi:MAG: hypothetical protein KAY37_07240 [Phycisphaerae bacterium]|nr:hypothetical protein [Phycisphaerae bacterium]
MRIEVELRDNVWTDLRNRFTTTDRESFVTKLELIRREPIKHSEAARDPDLSEYMLRFFRFGTNDRWIAMFEYDIARNRIKVLECRLLKPRKRLPRLGRHDRVDPQ